MLQSLPNVICRTLIKLVGERFIFEDINEMHIFVLRSSSCPPSLLRSYGGHPSLQLVGDGLPSEASASAEAKDGGRGRIRTYEAVRQQIYSLSRLTASVPALNFLSLHSGAGTRD